MNLLLQNLGVSENLVYLCSIKVIDMEEKKYPTFEEEDPTGMVAEPMEAVHVANKRSGIVHVHDELDDIDWDNYPIFGPKTQEEAIDRIEKAEAEINDPTRWVPSEELDRMLYEKYPWLR